MDVLLFVFLFGLILQGIKVLINHLLNTAWGLAKTSLLPGEAKELSLAPTLRYDKNQPSGSIAFTTSTAKESIRATDSPAPSSQKAVNSRELFMRSTYHQSA